MREEELQAQVQALTRDRDEWKEATIAANDRFKLAEEKNRELTRENAEQRAKLDELSRNSQQWVPERLLRESEARERELVRERDLAIAHDRQPYPTAEAYEAACAALSKTRDERDALKSEKSLLTKALAKQKQFHHEKHRQAVEAGDFNAACDQCEALTKAVEDLTGSRELLADALARRCPCWGSSDQDYYGHNRKDCPQRLALEKLAALSPRQSQAEAPLCRHCNQIKVYHPNGFCKPSDDGVPTNFEPKPRQPQAEAECPDPEAHEKGDLLLPCDHKPQPQEDRR